MSNTCDTTIGTNHSAKKSYVLAFDLLTSGHEVLLWEIASQTVYITGHSDAARPSAQLHENIKEILLQQQVDLKTEVKLIATTRGPGSFTGIRAGLAAARGLSEAAGTPLVCPTIPDILLYSAQLQDLSSPYSIWLDAHGGNIFYTPKANNPTCQYGTLSEARAALPDSGTLITNLNQLPELPQELTIHQVANLELSTLAQYAWQNHEQLTQEPPIPLYLKPLTYKKISEQQKK